MHAPILDPGFLVVGGVWNDVLIYSFRTLFFISAVLLMVIILLQEGKGGGLASALGGQGAETFGVSSGGVNKVTLVLAALFLISALGHGLRFHRSVADSLKEKATTTPRKAVEDLLRDQDPPKKEGAGSEGEVPVKKAEEASPPKEGGVPPKKDEGPPK